MKSFTYVIQDEVGIHARPAGILAKEVKKYSSRITISGNGKSADAGKLTAVMGMGIKKGMEVTVTAEGDDEDTAIAETEKFFRENF